MALTRLPLSAFGLAARSPVDKPGIAAIADQRRPEITLDAVLEGIGEGFFALGPDWRFIAFNAAAERIFKLPRGEVLGRTLWEISPRIRRTEFERRYRRVMTEGVREEFRIASVYLPDRFHEVRAFPLGAGIGVAFRDITERHAIETALREREAELARVQRIGRVGGFEVDLRDGFRSRRSPEYLRLHGLTAEAETEPHEDWVGRLHPEDRERAVRRFKRAVRGRARHYRSEYRIVRPNDGEIRWISASAEIERDEAGRPLKLIGAHLDMTERKRAELALGESEQRFRTIADSAPVPIWVTARDGKRSFVNRAYCEFFGLSFEEALELDWREALHPEDVPRIPSYGELGGASRKPLTVEARYRRADGEWRWMRSESQPRWGVAGEQIGFIGVAHDVTAAKQAEVELRQMNETLERRVRERSLELEVAEESLRHAQKMEAIGQLTGGIAHDFNNLLQGIIGSLDLIGRRAAQGRMGEVERFIATATRATNRAAALTHRLLAFARRQPLSPRPILANRLVASMEELLRRTMGEQVELRLSLAAGLWPTLCDANQLENAILNLAINARDAMPEGGRLTIATDNAPVDAAVADRPRDIGPGQYICIAVTDTGVGMTAEVMARAPSIRSSPRSPPARALGLASP